MKNRILTVILCIALAFGLATAITACKEAEKAEYSVTVLAPDESPLTSVYVAWMDGSKMAGSAITDADGKATASIAQGTYSITLMNFGSKYEYTPVLVSAATPNVTLTLSVTKVNYVVTVKDKNGAFASGVKVSWMQGVTTAGNAVTGADGKASCELDYGDYSVALSDLPDGNIYDGAQSVRGASPATEFTLRDGESVTYSITVRSEGGLLFKDHAVTVYDGASIVAGGKTDENGVFTFSAIQKNYRATCEMPKGYTQGSVTINTPALEGEIVMRSSVIRTAPSANETYVIGDIIHDYSFKTPYPLGGLVWQKSISEILLSRQMLIINNWGTNCSWCVTEMPDMQKVYEKYSDKIEIVAVSNYMGGDKDELITNYYITNGYTFPMMRDTNGLADKFEITGWPTTIIIDRYGAIARIEKGAITSIEAWERMINKYIGDDYKQDFVPGDKVSSSINNEYYKPDVTVTDDHYEKMAQLLNKTETFHTGANIEWFGETEYELAWPFVMGTVENVSPQEEVVYSSNTGKENSMSVLYATVTVEAGKVFTFDYYSDTEAGADILNIVWDGKIVKNISGNSVGWQTCQLYTDLTDGSHSLALTYVKDSTFNKGLDNVYLRNFRFTDISSITQSTDMLRGAGYGTITGGADKFPYYADVEIESDGYYHVNLSTLRHSEYAGSDKSPLLFVNLMKITPWNNYYSLSDLILGTDESGEYAFDCTFTINDVTRDYRTDLVKYLSVANSSKISGYVPVDGFLHDMLVEFMKNVSGERSHDNEWLEVCYFYSHYGEGEPVSNPIKGLMKNTAIEAVADKEYIADLTHNGYPFPILIYTFTPSESAVYKFESFIPDEDKGQYMSQIWLFDDNFDEDHPIAYCDGTHITLDAVNEHNFELYHYLEKGKKYYFEVAFQMMEKGELKFIIKNIGQSAYEFRPCSDDIYEMILDENETMIGIKLSGAVEYVIDEEGYYRAKNPDGTQGDYIYLDVLRVSTSVLGSVPLYKLVNLYMQDPEDHTPLDYKMFDFRYCVSYNIRSVGGEEIITYTPKLNITGLDARYKDYTDILKAYIDGAPTEGGLKGLIKVNQELVDILTLFMELRSEAIYGSDIKPALENEWLRFCWYTRKYDQTNP